MPSFASVTRRQFALCQRRLGDAVHLVEILTLSSSFSGWLQGLTREIVDVFFSFTMLMLCSAAGRPLLYMSFDDPVLTKELHTMVRTLRALDCSVAELYSWLVTFDHRKTKQPGALFSYITQRASNLQSF